MAKTYRKTATIQAIQFTGENLEKIREFTNGLAFKGYKVIDEKGIVYIYSSPLNEEQSDITEVFYIKTLEGPLEFTPGCWIASGGNDDFWAIQDDIFVKTYEEVV